MHRQYTVFRMASKPNSVNLGSAFYFPNCLATLGNRSKVLWLVIWICFTAYDVIVTVSRHGAVGGHTLPLRRSCKQSRGQREIFKLSAGFNIVYGVRIDGL
jgi:hypothetical protein